MRWREMSSSQPSCSTCNFCQRFGSLSDKSRRCTLAKSLAWAATAPQAGRDEFSWLMSVSTLDRGDNTKDTTRRTASHPVPVRSTGDIRPLVRAPPRRPTYQARHRSAWAKVFSAPFGPNIAPALRYSAATTPACDCRYYRSETARYWYWDWDDRNPNWDPVPPRDPLPRRRP